MKTKTLFQKMVLALGRVMPGIIFLLLTRPAGANPTGMTVQSGTASATASGLRLTVTNGGQQRRAQLAELQHRAGRDHGVQPAVGRLGRVEPRQRPQSIGNIWHLAGERYRGAVEFIGLLFWAEFVCERSRAGGVHGQLHAATEQRRVLGVQRAAASGEHRELWRD